MKNNPKPNYLKIIVLCQSLLLPGLSHGAMHDNRQEPFKNIPPETAISLTEQVYLGGGGVCRTVFWPIKHIDPDGNQVKWLGEVFALLKDENGDTYEDTNRNRTLDFSTDERVDFFNNNGELSGCYGDLNADGNCAGTIKPINQIALLWSAASRLNSIPKAAITTNRSDINNSDDPSYISASPKRNIFTWNDLDNDGIVDSPNEIFPFEANWQRKPAITSVGDQNRGRRNPKMIADFGKTARGEMNALINWVRGLDQAGFRSRSTPGAMEGELLTWRLGDIINSTPVMVSRPAENYHLLYKDESYASFVAHYKHRRQVIYFGGNDAMLHAVNGGFYQESSRKFCLTANCQNESSAPLLGTELWAYIPYNLAPHLQCLAEPDYEHEYFVDLKPKVFDVRIFNADQDHPEGWGTILVGGMRLGGIPVSASQLSPAPDFAVPLNDQRVFSSSYFIFDITNPEKPPILLGEMTHLNEVKADSQAEARIGSTTSSPAVVPVVNNAAANDGDWYLVFGNGPTELDGTSKQKPHVFVMPLNWLAGTKEPDHELRFPLYDSAGMNASLKTDHGAAYELPAAKNGFIGDPVAADFELLPDYKANVVYFGTSEHQTMASGHNSEGKLEWGGKMYRLVVGDRKYVAGKPYQAKTTPMDWRLNILLDVQQPVNSPATVGWDKENFWVYFGTGKLANHGCEKQNNDPQSFYGLKEPMKKNIQMTGSASGEVDYCAEIFSWAAIDKECSPDTDREGLLDVTAISVFWNGIFQNTTITGFVKNDYQGLIDAVAGVKRGCDVMSPGLDGWYRNFQVPNEHYIGSANLFGGLLTFSTYSLSPEKCFGEGENKLYVLDYQTGTAWQEPVFQVDMVKEGETLAFELELGRGVVSAPKIQPFEKKTRKNAGSQKGKQDQKNNSKPADNLVIQTSSGTVIKIALPVRSAQKLKTGRQSWFEGIPKTP